MLGGIELYQALCFARYGRGYVAGVCEKTVAVGHLVCADWRQAFLVTLPAFAMFCQLVGDGLTDSVPRGWNRQIALDTYQARRAWIGMGRIWTFIGQIEGGRFCICPGSRDGANIRARREIGIGGGGTQVRAAAAIVPIRTIVATHAEVRSADDFQIVCRAGMPNGVIVRRGVRGLHVLVGKRRVGVTDDLAETVVFHDDDEDSVQIRSSFWNRALRSEHGAHKADSEYAQHYFPFHKNLSFTEVWGSTIPVPRRPTN